MNKITVTLLFFLFLTAGCAKQENYIVLMPGEDGSTGALSIETHKGTVTLNEPGKAIYIVDQETKPSQPTVIPLEQTDLDFAQALAVHPLMPQSFLLYFEFDSNRLTTESKQLLTKIVATAHARKNSDIAIIGHTDRTGEDAYNEKLSLERAKSIFSLLQEEGLNKSVMQISYHGEGNPLVPTADNVAEPRNRRVEVVVR